MENAEAVIDVRKDWLKSLKYVIGNTPMLEIHFSFRGSNWVGD
jgi:hypothetical protein